MAPKLRRSFPKRALDYTARTACRERRLVCSPSPLVSPDPRFVACTPILLPSTPQPRSEPNAAERYAHRGAYTRCRADRAGHGIRQPRYGSIEEAGRGTCKVWRRFHRPVKWRSQGTQEPLSRRQRDERKGDKSGSCGTRASLEKGCARRVTITNCAAHGRPASSSATRTPHHPCCASSRKNYRLRTCVARSSTTEHQNRGASIASQQ